MAIITLTTDFGTRDHLVGSLKGSILRELPDAQIVDISHDVSPYSIIDAAYILGNAFRQFPEGSIHILAVDSESNADQVHLGIVGQQHYFIGPDNGVFSLIFQERRPDVITELNIFQKTDSMLFPSRDVYVPAACHLSRGGKLEVIGKVRESMRMKQVLRPVVSQGGNEILGSVIFIDRFGNAVTNISKQLFYEVGKSRSFEITYGGSIKTPITRVFEQYKAGIPEGKRMALFNSAGLLEIAIFKGDAAGVGGASSLLGIRRQERIKIEFK
jgi:S-adenosylmethionine hydrolase